MKSKVFSKVIVLFVLILSVVSFMAFPIFAEDLGSWVTKADMSNGRYGLTVVEAGGKIYAIGGIDSATNGYTNIVEEYNPITNLWTVKANMPTARAYAAGAVVSGKIYIFGGYTSVTVASNVSEVYDISTNTWSTIANMPTGRCSATSVNYNGEIYVIGGLSNASGSNTRLSTVEVYNPATNSWANKASMPVQKNKAGAGVINGKIYVAGGEPSPEILEYNPTTDTWVTKAQLNIKREGVGAVVLNNKLYIVGGLDIYNASTGAKNIVEEYDPNTNTCVYKASILTTRYGLGAAAANNKIYIMGGYGQGTTNQSYKQTEEYTPPITLPTIPTNLIATAGNAKVDLSWTAVTGAASYNIKRSTTAGGPYTTVGTSTAALYTDTTVTNGTTYYYVVTAVNSAGESTNSIEASAKPMSSSSIQGNRAILQITMTSGLVKEYDLSAAEIDAFLKWIDDKESGAAGTKAYFPVNKTYNVKPFLTRKEYFVYSKIQDFEIKDYID